MCRSTYPNTNNYGDRNDNDLKKAVRPGAGMIEPNIISKPENVNIDFAAYRSH